MYYAYGNCDIYRDLITITRLCIFIKLLAFKQLYNWHCLWIKVECINILNIQLFVYLL